MAIALLHLQFTLVTLGHRIQPHPLLRHSANSIHPLLRHSANSIVCEAAPRDNSHCRVPEWVSDKDDDSGNRLESVLPLLPLTLPVVAFFGYDGVVTFVTWFVDMFSPGKWFAVDGGQGMHAGA